MPRADWMSDRDYAAFERCLEDVGNKKDINKYAVCSASIKDRKERIKTKVSKRLT